jgi:hypothetical protein
MGEKRNMYRLFVRKPEGKRPLGRPGRRWIDNIKMDLLEIGLDIVDSISLIQDRYRWRAELVTASILRSSPILVTLMKEALSSYETSVLTRATRHNIPEDTILHSHRRENLKSYRWRSLVNAIMNLHKF